MCREVRECMLEEFAWRVYNAMLGRAVRGMRGVKPMDKRWIQCAEESRRALLKRYPAAVGAELREFCAAAGRFGQITGGAMFLQGYTLARIPLELLPALTGERNVYRCAGAIYSALVMQPGGRERFLFLCELQGARVECLQELARMQEAMEHLAGRLRVGEDDPWLDALLRMHLRLYIHAARTMYEYGGQFSRFNL